jgi:diguanylate cyclase (GGDEF)-like protein
MSPMREGTARDARRRQAAALGLSACMIAVGAVLAMRSTAFPVAPPLTVPWWALIPLYALTQHFPVDFETRRTTYSVHLTQLPLALGAILVAPGYHLAARLIGVGLDCLVVRRQSPLKAAFNLASAAIEVGLATTAVALLGQDTRPGAGLGVALLGGVVISDVIGVAALGITWRVLGLTGNLRQLLAPLRFAVLASASFTGLALVAVSALYTDRFTVIILLALGGGLAIAYRANRRMFAQQRSTEKLYDFVKDLGPVALDSGALAPLLDEVRVLLHARYLDLAVPTEGAGWQHFTCTEDNSAAAPPDADELADAVARTGVAALRSTTGGRGERMATPLIGERHLVGILTVRERLGEIRGFDMGDLRLLETVASQLTTTFERGRLLADLARSATTDSLTGLPNLTEVTRRIADELAQGDVLVAAVAVDSFREVNDTLGHEIGDNLLVEVAHRLVRACPDAIVGRIGGGRFAVALPVRTASIDPDLFGLGIRAQVEGTAQVSTIGTHIRLSVGVVRAPDHGAEAATLLRRAETAMHSARDVHGGPVLWEPAYEVKGQRRLAVVTALREALTSGAIGLAFQPKVDTATGATTGVEALARWSHPALGPIGPDEFVPLAETSGLMGVLTSNVLRQALVACKGWQRRARNVGVAVNVSADTVLDPAFVTEVAAIITSVGLPADLLTLELTEGVVVADPALAVERMGELRTLGVQISVDDFGTGYSSLTYLKGLPVDEVKIDKGFVDGLATDPADRAVVRAVVDIAHTLGLKVVAEGVEHEAQHELLRTLGVDEVQGFLHARPMGLHDLAQWLRTREHSPHA